MSRPRPSQYPLIHDSFLWVVSRCLSVSFLSRDKILYYLIVWINNLSISLATSPPRTSRHQRVFFRFFLVERTIIHSVRHRHCIPPGVIWTFVVSHSVSRMQRWNVSQIFSKSFIFSCILRSSSSYSSSRLLWNHSVLTHHRPSSFWKLDRLLTSFSWSLFPYDDFIWRSWSEFLSTCQCTFSRPWFFGVLKYIWTSSNDNKTPTQLYIRFLTRKWVRGGGGKDKVQNTFTITTRNSKKKSLEAIPIHTKSKWGVWLGCKTGRLRRCETTSAALIACILTLQVGLDVFLAFSELIWDFLSTYYRIALDRVDDDVITEEKILEYNVESGIVVDKGSSK